MALTNLSSSLIQDTYEKLVQIEGAQIADGSGSLVSTLEVTASRALVAETALNVDTGSLMVTGSISGDTITFTKGDGTTFPIVVPAADTSALNAFTASADLRLDSLEAETGSLQSQITTNSLDIDSNAASISSNITQISTNTTNIATNTSGIATNASGIATNAADIATNAAGIATNAGNIATNTSDISTNDTRISGLEAETGSYAKVDVDNVFTGTQTFNNIEVNGTGSFAYIQSVTGSAKVIGDAFIVLNNDTPTERYAGIKVIDSGSIPATTASLQFDGLYNDWFYEYEKAGDADDFAVFLAGPEFSTKGIPSYPTNNAIQKGLGTHHLGDSIMTDDGSTVSVGGDLSASTITATTAFVGNLTGNADTATSASYAANVEAVEGVVETATEIQFSNGIAEIYATSASPRSGNITISATSTKRVGATAIIYHSDTVQPSIIGGAVSKTFGEYDTTATNIIYLTYDGANYIQNIAGAVAAASLADVTAVGATTADAITSTGGFIGNLTGNADTATSALSADSVEYADVANKPAGLVESLSVSSPSQGTVRATINGAPTDVDTGLQSGDSPTFAGATIAGVTYPTVDGSPNQAIITDGAGNLTFGDVAGDPQGATDTGVTNVVFSNAIGTIYNTAASPATGDITLSGTGAVVGGVAIIYHNDATAPTISGLTADKTLGVYSASNLNIITIIYTGANVIVSIAGISPAVEGSAETGDLLFENQIGEIYGDSTTPLTGNITISASSTKVIGASAILYHNDASEPTVSGGTIAKKVGSYDAGALNMIAFAYLGNGEYIQTIAGADVSGIITNSTDTYTGTAAVNNIVTLTQVEYDAIGTPDANTLYVIV